jgi:sulfate permease, SulP family
VNRLAGSIGLFSSLRGYKRDWLAGDALAGLTVWAVLVPEALAYATIAGVSPVVGLYAAPAALIFYAAFGSSRYLIAGPSAATAALSAATVGDIVAGNSGAFVEMTAALAVTVGIVAVVSGLLRLGFVASFVSEPVLKGFIVGLALTIMIAEAPKLFGLGPGDGDFFEQAWDLIRHLGEADGLTMIIGFGSLALILGMKRALPRMPAYLAAVLLGIVVVELFGLQDDTAIVGPVEQGLPAVGLPGVGLGDGLDLLAGAFGIMFVGFAEGLGAARSYAARDHAEIDPNRELIGVGVANLGAGLSSGMTVNGSLSKTAVSVSGGARTQLAGLVVAALVVLTIAFLTGLFESLPQATLAAVVVAALVDLVDIPALVDLYRTYTVRLGRVYGFATRADFIASLAAMLGVMVFDTLPGLVIGIAISLVLLVYRSSRPNVARLGRLPGRAGHWDDIDRHADAVEDPAVVVLRPEGGLFFANSDQIRREVLAAVGPGTRGVVLDGETVAFVDVTAAQMLRALRDQLASDGIGLYMAKDIGQVRDVIARADPGDPLVHALFPTIHQAIEAAKRRPPIDDRPAPERDGTGTSPSRFG